MRPHRAISDAKNNKNNKKKERETKMNTLNKEYFRDAKKFINGNYEFEYKGIVFKGRYKNYLGGSGYNNNLYNLCLKKFTSSAYKIHCELLPLLKKYSLKEIEEGIDRIPDNKKIEIDSIAVTVLKNILVMKNNVSENISDKKIQGYLNRIKKEGDAKHETIF